MKFFNNQTWRLFIFNRTCEVRKLFNKEIVACKLIGVLWQRILKASVAAINQIGTIKRQHIILRFNFPSERSLDGIQLLQNVWQILLQNMKWLSTLLKLFCYLLDPISKENWIFHLHSSGFYWVMTTTTQHWFDCQKATLHRTNLTLMLLSSSFVCHQVQP